MEEIDLLREITNNNFVILEKTKTGCYIIENQLEVTKEENQKEVQGEHTKSTSCRPVNPYRMVKYKYYYFMENRKEPGIWYRGGLNSFSIYTFNICFDSLEKAVKSV